MGNRKLTAAEKAEKRRRKQEFETIFVHGKMKRVRRPPTIDGLTPEEFVRRNADPIWLHQNEMWEYLEEQPQIDGLLDGPMGEMTKAQKRHLRDLAAIAYKRELGAALQDLHGHFARWQADEITTWDLSELIHAHHNGISRELYKLYAGASPAMPVARALARDVIRWDEVKDDCKPLLTGMVEYFGDESPCRRESDPSRHPRRRTVVLKICVPFFQDLKKRVRSFSHRARQSAWSVPSTSVRDKTERHGR